MLQFDVVVGLLFMNDCGTDEPRGYLGEKDETGFEGLSV